MSRAAYFRAWRARNREEQLRKRREYLATPEGRYSQQKMRAKQRGIEFNLSFEEWWTLWEPHWEERGTGAEALCMCRDGDIGAYEVGNVRIDTNLNNRQEQIDEAT